MAGNQSSAGQVGRIVAVVVGGLLLIATVSAMVGGAVLGLGYAFARDDAGFFEVDLERIESDQVAVTSAEVDLGSEPGTPSRAIDALDTDVRLRATSTDAEEPIFVGIASQDDVESYLEGVGRDEISSVRGDRPVLRNREGGTQVSEPTSETFWEASSSGTGRQEVIWPATQGRWAAVVMNADASPGVEVDMEVGAKAGFVLPLALLLLVLGLIGTALAVALIVFGASGLGRRDQEYKVSSHAPAPAITSVPSPFHASPVRLEAHLDPELSRWMWLVKWFLASPHWIILFFLWIAFFILTVVAGFAILFTGRYPRGIFDFNVGVMRWGWRVTYYASGGGLGTDRYPPFSLDHDPAYPATLDVEHPGELSRGLVLVKWWLLAIPHYLVIGLFAGGTFLAASDTGRSEVGALAGGGLIGLLVVIAAVTLLFTARYPRSLFELIVGLNRWVFRVVAYAGLMTDRYPPFRLDQGGTEPSVVPAEDDPTPAAVDESPRP